MPNLFQTRNEALKQIMSTDASRGMELARLPVGRGRVASAGRLGGAIADTVGGLFGAQRPELKKAEEFEQIQANLKQKGVSLAKNPEEFYSAALEQMSGNPNFFAEAEKISTKLTALKAAKIKSEQEEAKIGIDRRKVGAKEESNRLKAIGSLKDRAFESVFNTEKDPDKRIELLKRFVGVEDPTVTPTKPDSFERSLSRMVADKTITSEQASELRLLRARKVATGQKVAGILPGSETSPAQIIYEDGSVKTVGDGGGAKAMTHAQLAAAATISNNMVSGEHLLDLLIAQAKADRIQLGIAGQFKRVASQTARTAADLVSLIPGFGGVVSSLRQGAEKLLADTDIDKENFKEERAAARALLGTDKITPSQLPVIQQYLTFVVARSLNPKGRLLADSLKRAEKMVNIDRPDDEGAEERLMATRGLLRMHRLEYQKAHGFDKDQSTVAPVKSNTDGTIDVPPALKGVRIKSARPVKGSNRVLYVLEDNSIVDENNNTIVNSQGVRVAE